MCVKCIRTLYVTFKVEGVRTLTGKKLRYTDRWRCRERGRGREREQERENKGNGERERPSSSVLQMLHISFGGEADCVAINTLPQLGVHFNLQYDIFKSEPLDEGHLPEEDFFSASLFFILPSWAEGWCNRNQTQARM